MGCQLNVIEILIQPLLNVRLAHVAKVQQLLPPLLVIWNFETQQHVLLLRNVQVERPDLLPQPRHNLFLRAFGQLKLPF